MAKFDFVVTREDADGNAPCGSVTFTFTDEEWEVLMKVMDTIVNGAAPAYDGAVLEVMYDGLLEAHFKVKEATRG